jgi:hypothetical protein
MSIVSIIVILREVFLYVMSASGYDILMLGSQLRRAWLYSSLIMLNLVCLGLATGMSTSTILFLVNISPGKHLHRNWKGKIMGGG